jgi:hypothetical protein
MKCPTEVPITDRREKELADQGFIPLVHAKAPTTRPSSAYSQPKRRSSTTRKRPTPTRGSPRSCLTSSRSLALRTISKP